MARYVTVANGVVVNAILAESDFAGTIGAIRSDEADIGWFYEGETFTAPPPGPPVIPDRVSARQFRLQLRSSGLLDQVKAWVEQQDGAVRDSFEYSSTFARAEPMMEQGFAALGFTPQQVDSFFLAASGL